MIERCNYCGKEHETGEGEAVSPMVIKVCPEIDPNLGLIGFNPTQWYRLGEGDGSTYPVFFTDAEQKVITYDPETGKGVIRF